MATTNHSLPSDGDFARLEGELFARIDRRHRGQVLRHRLVATAVVVVVAGAGVAAGTIANPTQETRFGYCYSAASTSSPETQIALSEKSGAARPSPAKVLRAVKGCEGLWSAGALSRDGSTAVPELQPCLRDDLVIAVFPRKDSKGTAAQFCENLGLSAP